MSQSPIAVGMVVLASALVPLSVPAIRAPEGSPMVKYREDDRASIEGYFQGDKANNVYVTTWVLPTVNSVAQARQRATNSLREDAMHARLSDVKALHDGWLGGISKAPDATVVQWIEDHLDVVSSAPYVVSIVPVADGSIALQWEDEAHEFTAEIHNTDHMLVFSDHLLSDEIDEWDVPLTSEALSAFLHRGDPA